MRIRKFQLKNYKSFRDSGPLSLGTHSTAVVVQKLNAETLKILAMPDVRERFLAQGLEPVGSTPEQFADHIRAQMAKWGKVVADAGVKAE